jgi:hypothetical protein
MTASLIDCGDAIGRTDPGGCRCNQSSFQTWPYVAKVLESNFCEEMSEGSLDVWKEKEKRWSTVVALRGFAARDPDDGEFCSNGCDGNQGPQQAIIPIVCLHCTVLVVTCLLYSAT